MKLIDADTLVKEVCTISCNKDRNASPHINSCFETGCKAVIAIENAPVIEAEPVRHGHWIYTGSGTECNVCHEIQYGIDNYRFYCQNCGAKMDEVVK